MVALKHSEGIKQTVLFQNPKLTINNKNSQYTPSLSLSLFLVFLTILSTQINTSWTLYLYTKSEYKNSKFQSVKAAVDRRCESGWRLRLVAGGWSVAAGRWWVVAFLDWDLLD